jgi:LmbE family N-acetylglucosaminyl deacetylase
VLTGEYDLLLSPHPDDLVFSTFSILSSRTEKLALVYFNVSKFTRWNIKSKLIVTTIRTLEDKIILSLLGTKTAYLFLPDDSIRNSSSEHLENGDINWLKETPSEIFCPLGVGGNPDHLKVRDRGIRLHRTFKKKPKLFFYEELPYAARHSDSTESRLQELSPFFASLKPSVSVLSSDEMKRKLIASRAYFSQNDHRVLLLKRAKEVGEESSGEYAEMFYLAK